MKRLDPASVDLPTLASLAGGAASEHLLEALRGAGHPDVRASHGYVFQLLIDGPKAIGELSSLLGVTQQAASKVALELESLGYVARQAATNDSRVKRVALTPKGKAVIEEARAARTQLEARVRAKVGARAAADARLVLLTLLELTGQFEAVAARRVKPPAADRDSLGSPGASAARQRRRPRAERRR